MSRTNSSLLNELPQGFLDGEFDLLVSEAVMRGDYEQLEAWSKELRTMYKYARENRRVIRRYMKDLQYHLRA